MIQISYLQVIIQKNITKILNHVFFTESHVEEIDGMKFSPDGKYFMYKDEEVLIIPNLLSLPTFTVFPSQEFSVYSRWTRRSQLQSVYRISG